MRCGIDLGYSGYGQWFSLFVMTSRAGEVPFAEGETVCVVCTSGSSFSYSVEVTYGICLDCKLLETVCINCGDPSYIGAICKHCMKYMDDEDGELHFTTGYQPEEYEWKYVKEMNIIKRQ